MTPLAFDPKAIAHLASLAALSLTEDEVAKLAHDLAAIVGHVAALQAVDTSAAHTDGPTAAIAPSAWRDDVVTPGVSREMALRGAPRHTDDGFAVPGFVETGARPVRGDGG
jgi:aspartyl-tRNA(Asn)/glutamyl-tRNA(Gln) amidotransferase subunit C